MCSPLISFNKKHINSFVALLSATLFIHPIVHAVSFNIPKSVIDKGIMLKFPLEKKFVNLENPVTLFNPANQKIEICGDWKVKLVQQKGSFCVDFHPYWNKQRNDIEISSVNLLKLTANEGREVSSSIAGLLNLTLLSLLDGTSIYHVSDFDGKFISNIEIKTDYLIIDF